MGHRYASDPILTEQSQHQRVRTSTQDQQPDCFNAQQRVISLSEFYNKQRQLSYPQQPRVQTSSRCQSQGKYEELQQQQLYRPPTKIKQAQQLTPPLQLTQLIPQSYSQSPPPPPIHIQNGQHVESLSQGKQYQRVPKQGASSKNSRSNPDRLVFDDDNAAKESKLRKINLFKRTPPTTATTHSPASSVGRTGEEAKAKARPKKSRKGSVIYSHSNQSDEILELMPTIAMGYENSFDKQLYNTNRELRITSDGYYFTEDPQPEPGLYQPSSQEPDRSSHFDHPSYESLTGLLRKEQEIIADDLLDINGIHPYEQYEQALISESESSNRIESSAYPDVSTFAKPMLENIEPPEQLKGTEEIENPEENKKSRKGFKRFFGIKSNKKKKAKPVEDESVNVEAALIPDDSQSKPEEEEVVNFPQQLSYQQEEKHGSISDLINSIPIVSTVFIKIDHNTRLTPQQKLVLKVALILWGLYEIQSLLEMITSFITNPFQKDLLVR